MPLGSSRFAVRGFAASISRSIILLKVIAAERAPTIATVIQMICRHSGNPFADYQVPEAAISLKQGFGRLIRSRSDRGILAILDNRITKQRYGQIFFDSLPDYGFTLDRGDVERFF